MKSVLISIQPKWCELIASGEKTVEVRKTRPKLETPFKCYIYCTKEKEHFSLGGGVYATQDTLYRLPTGEIKFGDGFELWGDWSGQYDESNFLNGKVIGEFVCDKVVEFENSWFEPSFEETSRLSCIDYDELARYIGKKDFGYGWQISNLVIYDKPRELSEFRRFCDGVGGKVGCRGCEYYYTESNESVGFYEECGCDNLRPLKRPPQSWCYVERSEGK